MSASVHIFPENHLTLVDIIRLPHALDLPLPTYATEQSAGVDLYAAIDSDIILKSGSYEKIPTGIAIALPKGFEAQLRSRSGLAAKNGLAVLNAPGTIDSDYRGEIIVILINHGSEDFTITRGMRFAQMVVAPHATVSWQEKKSFEKETERGTMGRFGSTGLR